MNSLRRHMMMQQAGGGLPDYIQDGLVLWLDGIEKGNNAGTWTDLASGNIFTYNDVNHCIELKNGVQFDGQGWASCPNDNISYNYRDHTIEVVCRSIAYGSIINELPIFTTGRSGQICAMFSIEDSFKKAYYASNTWTSTYNLGTVHIEPIDLKSAQMNYSRALLNGHRTTEMIGASVISQTIKPDAYIARYFGGSWDGKYNGIIHSLRVYNRTLSFEEMEYNSDIDNRRFNFGL